MQYSVSDRIRKEVTTYISCNFTEKNIDIDFEENLIEGGLIDSISLMKLLIFIETQYDINLNENDYNIDNFASIKRICDFIQSKQ